MSRRFALALVSIALIAAGCGDGDSSDTTSTAASSTAAPTTAPPTTAAPTTAPPTTAAPTTSPPTTAAPAAGGLVIASIDFDAGVVVFRNDGDADYDTAGHFVCNRPTYVPLPAQVLAPGESVTVTVSGLGVTPEDGEVGLYTSQSFGSPDAIIGYVQWGSDSHGRTSVAVDAGIWPAGGVVPAGGSLELTGDPTTPDGWTVR